MLSVLFQDFPDFELIVQDNCSTPETYEVVKQYPSPKLKYQRSTTVLPMNQNWEMALNLCEGEYIYFMGDDDGLMPDGLRLADDILHRVSLEVLSWRKYTYWWDNALEPALQGRLFIHVGSQFQTFHARRLLESCYDWTIGFGTMPSIYNSLVHRNLVDRIRGRSGGVYFAAGAPDAWTGITNAAFTEQVGIFERGISMCGNSGFSTGCSYFFRSKGAERRDLYHREEGKTIEQIVHPLLIPCINLEISNADVMIRAKEMLFPKDERLQVKIPTVVQQMANNINRDPDAYDEVLGEIRALSDKYAIPMSAIQIPARAPAVRSPVQGPLFGPNQQLDTLAVYCPLAGVHDVHQAARLASAILPGLTIQ